MPTLAGLLPTAELGDAEMQSENILLYLPSAVGSRIPVMGGLAEKETRLRLAQADDALAELRRLLRITVGLRDYKYTQLGPSQRAGTRARSLISRFQGKIDRCAERYRAARSALLNLDANGDWSQRLFELRKEHVKGPGRGTEDESEGRRDVSWIWLMRSEALDDGIPTEDEIGHGM